ncbi:hypothetical protein H6G64_10120 [Calothrix sp. FACHB-156]|nr:hypothetical protein [Calothrix sp. FACHB-156]
MLYPQFWEISPSQLHHSTPEPENSRSKVKRSPSQPHRSTSEHKTPHLKQKHSHLEQERSRLEQECPHLKQEHSRLKAETSSLGDRTGEFPHQCYFSEERRSRKYAKFLRTVIVLG